eukprot:g279.t1
MSQKQNSKEHQNEQHPGETKGSGEEEETAEGQVTINVEDPKKLSDAHVKNNTPTETGAQTGIKEVEIELVSTTSKTGLTKAKKLKQARKIEVSLLELFDTLDHNDSGFLSNQEILVGLHMIGLKVEASKCIQAIKSVQNGNSTVGGKMDCDQFLDFMKLISETQNLELLNKLLDALNSGLVNSKSVNSKLVSTASALKQRVAESEMEKEKNVKIIKETIGYRERQSKLSSMADSKFNEVETTSQKIWNFFMRGNTFYVTVVVAWILVGTAMYCISNGWNFGRSFYYSVQAGLSIGFGSLSEDKLTGTDLWGACTNNVTELVAMIIAQYPSGKLPNVDVGEICTGYSERNSLSDLSKFYSVIHLMLGASIISGVLSLFATMAVESSSKWYEELEDELQQGFDNKSHISKKWNKPEDNGCYGRMLKTYKSNQSMYNSLSLLFIWLTIGVIYGVTKEKWSFVTSLYFASAACSTGGLQGPTPDDFGVWFTALYSIIGVPIYGYTLGQFANGLSESYLKRMKTNTLASAITAAEFSVVSTLSGNNKRDASGHGGIDLFDFTLMELYRLHKTDEEEIKEIWANFKALDADGNGIFTRSEMQASLAFARHDQDNSSTLSLPEMQILIKDLQNEKSFEYEGLTMLPSDKEYTISEIKNKMKQFNDPNDEKILLDRAEFMKFWSKEFSDHIETAPLGSKMVELHHLMHILRDELDSGEKGNL